VKFKKNKLILSLYLIIFAQLNALDLSKFFKKDINIKDFATELEKDISVFISKYSELFKEMSKKYNFEENFHELADAPSINICLESIKFYLFIRGCNSLFKIYRKESINYCSKTILKTKELLPLIEKAHIKNSTQQDLENLTKFIKNELSVYENNFSSCLKLSGAIFYNEYFGILKNFIKYGLIRNKFKSLKPDTKGQAKCFTTTIHEVFSDIYILKILNTWHTQQLAKFLITNFKILKDIIENYKKENDNQNKSAISQSLKDLLSKYYDKLKINVETFTNYEDNNLLLKIIGGKFVINRLGSLVESKI
jgi:hypothetical protein